MRVELRQGLAADQHLTLGFRSLAYGEGMLDFSDFVCTQKASLGVLTK